MSRCINIVDEIRTFDLLSRTACYHD
jgi:hypothetical protein